MILWLLNLGLGGGFSLVAPFDTALTGAGAGAALTTSGSAASLIEAGAGAALTSGGPDAVPGDDGAGAEGVS
jgi:hypothetical protein